MTLRSLIESGTTPTLGDGAAPVVTDYSKPEFWTRLFNIADRSAGLSGEFSREDVIGTFLSQRDLLSDFPKEAIGGVLYLTSAGLQRLSVPRVMQVQILRFLMARDTDLQRFLSVGGPLRLETRIAISNSDTLPLQSVVANGCFELWIEQTRLSLMIKPTWGEGGRVQACPS